MNATDRISEMADARIRQWLKGSVFNDQDHTTGEGVRLIEEGQITCQGRMALPYRKLLEEKKLGTRMANIAI